MGAAREDGAAALAALALFGVVLVISAFLTSVVWLFRITSGGAAEWFLTRGAGAWAAWLETRH
jgi:hypothetical protein